MTVLLLNRILRFFLVLTCTAGLLSATPPPEQPLEIGAPAPDFRLPGVDGKTYTLADFADAELLAIIFTTNHCPTAQVYEERIQQLADEYRDRGVALVAISPNDPLAVRLDELGYTDLSDTLEEMKQRAEDKGFTFPYLYDGDTQSTAHAYGPVATPHAFVFDKERKLRYQGRIDDHEAGHNITSHDTRNAIEALLAGEPVPVETTRVFGCSIKWADKRDAAKEALARWDEEEAEVSLISLDEVREVVANDTDNLRLVNMWATWCGPCVVEFPEFVKMHRMYRNRPFELVTISMDNPDKHEQVAAFLQQRAASMTNYHFESDKRYDLIEAVDPEWPGALPYTVLIAPGGEVVYRQLGEINPLDLRRAVADFIGRTY